MPVFALLFLLLFYGLCWLLVETGMPVGLSLLLVVVLLTALGVVLKSLTESDLENQRRLYDRSSFKKRR